MAVATQTRPAAKESQVVIEAPRKHYCPCSRFLGESTAREGYFLVKCGGCGKWRRVEFRGVVT